MKEKAADRQSEIDELKAKMDFEKGERGARAKELAEKAGENKGGIGGG